MCMEARPDPKCTEKKTLGLVLRIFDRAVTVLLWVIAGIVLVVLVFLLLVFPLLGFVHHLTFDAKEAEKEARGSFAINIEQWCLDPNEFDGPVPTPPTETTSGYLFTWSMRNMPSQSIQIDVTEDDVYFSTSEQYSKAHPWVSEDCLAKRGLKNLSSEKN